jgi:hypothetical protein
MNWRTRAVGLAGLVLASLALLMWPLRAAPINPPIPSPPAPPPQLQPVLEVLAPVASTECGNAVLVMALVPVEAGTLPIPGGLPVNILPAFGPVFVVCGAVPQPATRLSCSPDAAAAAALNQVTAAAAGTPVPADTRVFGPGVQEVYTVQDNLPPPLSTAGLGDQVSGALTCRPLDAAAAPPVESPPAEAVQPPPDVSGFAFGGDVGAPPALPALASPPGTPSAVAPIVAQSQRPVVQSVAQVGGPGFAYPVVLVLPLLLLALGGYLGWALTRPVVPTQP